MRTADELNISTAEYKALIQVADMLESGMITHQPSVIHPLTPIGFNMMFSVRVNECGTVCCIGGWVSVLMQGNLPNTEGVYHFNKHEVSDYVTAERPPHGLHELYYPKGDVNRWPLITADMAVKAIRNYLETDRPSWNKV
jgi:hypothetical protein